MVDSKEFFIFSIMERLKKKLNKTNTSHCSDYIETYITKESLNKFNEKSDYLLKSTKYKYRESSSDKDVIIISKI